MVSLSRATWKKLQFHLRTRFWGSKQHDRPIKLYISGKIMISWMRWNMTHKGNLISVHTIKTWSWQPPKTEFLEWPINFFVSQPIFFNDPSKFVYCKGACTDEAQFLISGLGGRKISKNTLFFTFLRVFRLEHWCFSTDLLRKWRKMRVLTNCPLSQVKKTSLGLDLLLF